MHEGKAAIGNSALPSILAGEKQKAKIKTNKKISVFTLFSSFKEENILTCGMF